MPNLTLEDAKTIFSTAFEHRQAKGYKPLAVVILDAGGNLKAFLAEDGSSNNRFEVARGKAKGALAVGMGSRWLNNQAQDRPHFLAGLASVIDGGVVPVPGAVIAKNGDGEIVGCVGISGDTSDADEECAIKAIEAIGLVADTGG